MGSIWSVSRPHDFLQRAWADEVVLYDRLRGDTHLLEPLAAILFGYLSAAPQPLEALVQRLQANFLFDANEPVAGLAEATLAKLQGIDLVMAYA